MFDPTKPDDISKWQDKDLALLPPNEDDRQEYKSSITKDSDLADKIARAASGFWNSGGGLFIAGINKQGEVDGGIPNNVGRQSRRDWIDQAIAKVSPRARYVVHSIEEGDAGLNIKAGHAVYLIGYGESEVGPHMAPDNLYYIRAGAHTVPASHFIVEAIHSRRGLRAPALRHVLRRKPGNSEVLQLGIVSLSAIPAVDVSIQLVPVPTWLAKLQTNRYFPIHVPVISEQFPFFFDIHLLFAGEQELPTFDANLTYFDLSGRQYNSVMNVNIQLQLGPTLGGARGTQDIERELNAIARWVQRAAEAISSITR